MSSEISVTKKSSGSFTVRVDEGSSRSSHTVTISEETYSRLAQGRSKEDLIKDSFVFLLERESKEAIMSSFDLTAISTYFPEYESVIVS